MNYIDQQIDEESFISLTESMVKELVPQMGSRSKIFKKIEELKSTNRNLKNAQNTLSDQDPDQVLSHSYNSL